jgi:hypothetical protein
MGPLFNYNTFSRTLKDKFGYKDELQLLLNTTEAGKQRITVRLNRNAGLSPEKVCKVLLKGDPVLYDMVMNDNLIELLAETVEGTAFTKIETSGKLQKIIDKRKQTS